jgi:hypothetical protein
MLNQVLKFKAMQDMNTPPFAIRQKVVCLRDGKTTPIKKGAIYTVEDLNYNSCCKKASGWFVRLAELPDMRQRCCYVCDAECKTPGLWLHEKAFAPIETQYTDISKELADSFKDTDEVPDKILKPETVNN